MNAPDSVANIENTLPSRNRQWILNQRPKGDIDGKTFVLGEQPIPALKEGEILIKVLYLSFDPAQRPWMDDVPSYMPPVALGEPMRAAGIGQIVQSKNPAFPEGELIAGLLGWQEYALGTQANLSMLRPIQQGLRPTQAMSIFGGTSMTAYFGLLEVGQPKAGETIVVSGAAGATGSVACQIARIKGCKVIGIAGGQEKCGWLREQCAIPEVIDYHSESVAERLSELCPEGVNVFFDNVGGEILELLLDHMADYGRIVLCGAIASYNSTKPAAGPRNMFNVIARRIRMQGFIASDFPELMPRYREEFPVWVAEGKIAWREDIQEGFENIPATLQRLFSGRNKGKQLLKLADPV